MSGKGGIKALQQAQEARERRHAEAETEEDYLQDGLPAKPGEKAPPQSPAPTTDPAPKVGKSDRIHTSLYLPRDLWRRLREIAAAEDCKVHDLILEGVRHVVERRQRRGR